MLGLRLNREASQAIGRKNSMTAPGSIASIERAVFGLSSAKREA
jgi:hypothetical protein